MGADQNRVPAVFVFLTAPQKLPFPAVFVVVRYARRSAAFSGFMNERFIDEVMKPLGIQLEWHDEDDIIETEAEVD